MKFIIRKLEWWFRHFFVYPTLRVLFRNPIHGEPVDLQKVKKILFLRYDRIGDMIVSTPIFRKVKTINPALKVGVLSSPQNAEIIRFNPYVDQVHILHKSRLRMMKEILSARRLGYDVVVNLVFNRTTSGALLANVIAPKGIKVGQGEEKYRFYFNKLIGLPKGTVHMTTILSLYMEEAFSIPLAEDDLMYEISVDEPSRIRVREFLHRNGLIEDRRSAERGEYAVVNLSAKESYRRLTFDQATTMVRAVSIGAGMKTVVISSPEDHNFRQDVLSASGNENVLAFPETGVAPLQEIAHLIECSRLVITPDTSIVHFAVAMQTPLLGFYSRQQQDEWLPREIIHEIVRPPGRFPVSAISTAEIRDSIKSFTAKLKRDSTAGVIHR